MGSDTTETYSLAIVYSANSPVSINMGGISYTLQGGISTGVPFHLVYKERGLGVLGKSFRGLYIDGTLVREDTSSVDRTAAAIVNNFQLGGAKFGTFTAGADAQVAALNIYNKGLTPESISLAHLELSEDNLGDTTTPLSFTDIKDFHISDIEQEEFNGYKGAIDKAVMTSTTVGSYDIYRIREVTSYPAASNGLPGANIGTFGAYVMKNGDTSTFYPIESINRTSYAEDYYPSLAPPATNALLFKTEIVGLTTLVPTDIIKVFGVYDNDKQDDFSGEHTITEVSTNGGNITGFSWLSTTSTKIDKDAVAILDRDSAYLNLDYPQEFTNRKMIKPSDPSNITFYEGVSDGFDHVV